MTDDDRGVLELRIHGVHNTAPAAMLDLPADQVEEVLGDDLAGFWRPKNPEGAPGDDTRGHVPSGITREAYSWGGLARNSPGGGISAGSRVLAGLITAGWTLLLPFGLANVAYWTRRLDDKAPEGERGEGPGAAVVRVFGLCLTAFLVVTVCDVSMDLVATQCYRDRALICTRLPGLLGGLGAASPAVRLAVFSVVPVAALIGLWVLSSISRSRYERAFGSDSGVVGVGASSQPPPDNADIIAPVLVDRELWRGDVMVAGLARVHLAAGFAFVTVCLTWPALFASGRSCRKPKMLVSKACIDQVTGLHGAWGYGIALVLALVVLLTAVGFAVRGPGRPSGMPDRRSRDSSLAAGVLLFVSLVALAVAETFILVVPPQLGASSSLLGVKAMPTALLSLMLALAVWALFVRLSPNVGALWAILVLGALCWVAVDGRSGSVAVLVILLLMVAHLVALRDEGRRWQAWTGCAPGVFLGAALFAQNVVSSAVVLAVGDWLNGSNSASTLVPKRGTSAGTKTCGQLSGGHDACLTVPVPYVLLGTVAVLAVVVLAFAGGMAFLRSGSDLAELRILPDGFRRSARNARRFARLAHRAENLVGVLVGSALLLTLGATVASAAGWLHLGIGQKLSLADRSVDLSTAAVALLSVMALGALVKGAGNGTRRPLGIVWDLVSFLPRAAHPFAPPCYAERAVPELTSRVDWWLKQQDRVVAGQRRGGTKVVLSAHSLGGVLAVAAVMRAQLHKHEDERQIRLLTYGSQLRAYFGRFFPELLGPSVLGTPPSLAAALWSSDPWRRQKQEDQKRSVEERAGESGYGTGRLSVAGRVRWRSLWHPTDFIGFPVQSFHVGGEGAIDSFAEEVDRSGYLLGVLTHGNYPRTPQYLAALLDLADLPAAPTDPPDQPT